MPVFIPTCATATELLPLFWYAWTLIAAACCAVRGVIKDAVVAAACALSTLAFTIALNLGLNILTYQTKRIPVTIKATPRICVWVMDSPMATPTSVSETLVMAFQ